MLTHCWTVRSIFLEAENRFDRSGGTRQKNKSRAAFFIVCHVDFRALPNLLCLFLHLYNIPWWNQIRVTRILGRIVITSNINIPLVIWIVKIFWNAYWRPFRVRSEERHIRVNSLGDFTNWMCLETHSRIHGVKTL